MNIMTKLFHQFAYSFEHMLNSLWCRPYGLIRQLLASHFNYKANGIANMKHETIMHQEFYIELSSFIAAAGQLNLNQN